MATATDDNAEIRNLDARLFEEIQLVGNNSNKKEKIGKII